MSIANPRQKSEQRLQADPEAFALTTRTLLDELEIVEWMRRRDDLVHPESSRAYLDLRAADLRAELAHRERHRRDPGAPTFPDRDRALRDELDAIRDRIDLAGFVEKYTTSTLRRSGHKHVGHCPWHDDTEPSFVVYDDGHFHCYGCAAHGDLFDAAQRVFGTDTFAATVDVLATEAGLPRQKMTHDSRHLKGPVSRESFIVKQGARPAPAFALRGGEVVPR